MVVGAGRGDFFTPLKGGFNGSVARFLIGCVEHDFAHRAHDRAVPRRDPEELNEGWIAFLAIAGVLSKSEPPSCESQPQGDQKEENPSGKPAGARYALSHEARTFDTTGRSRFDLWPGNDDGGDARSEERRVGKEGRSGRSPEP